MKIPEKVIQFDPTIVRGLDYYTGPIYETVLTKEIKDEKGNIREFGGIISGGRYNNLTKRFINQDIPFVGCSLGVDRLVAALDYLGELEKYKKPPSNILVTIMDKNRIADYIKLANNLRNNGFSVDLYSGKKKINEQLKYADKNKIRIALIAGENEFEKKTIQIKDLYLGSKLGNEISTRKEWCQHPSQQEIPLADLMSHLKEILK